MKTDILTENDVKILVDTFYAKVDKDDLLSPVFNQQASVEWSKHLDTMYKFWGTLLIGTMNYNGSSFPPHARLKIKEEHFNQWLHLFIETVNENFQGSNAEIAIQRAKNIASVFQYKLGLTPSD